MPPLDRSLRRTWWLLPGGLWLASYALAIAAGVRFRLVLALLQLLDHEELLAHPLRSLLLLHGQPPGLNALLAALLAAARAGGPLGVEPETLGAIFFAALGLAACLLLYRLGLALTGRPGVALLPVVLLVLDPGFHVYSAVFFYSLPLLVLLLASLVAAAGWLEGRDEWLPPLVAAVAATSLTRSLYHPLWGLAFLGLVALARWRLLGSATPPRPWAGRPALLAAVAALALLFAWPAKNLLLFGTATTTSWTGFNLARGIPVRSPALGRYLDTGEVDPGVEAAWRRAGHPPWVRDAALLNAPSKTAGGRNWNHYTLLITGPELTRRALRWRLEHPRQWALRALAQYAMWSQPTWIDSYWRTPRGPRTALWRGWCRLHAAVPFFDLRPAIEGRTPGWELHRATGAWGGKIGYSLYGLVLLPAILLGAAWRSISRRRRWRLADWLALLAAFHLAWSLLVPCLTDGFEGNRMRFPTAPLVPLLALYAVLGPRCASLPASSPPLLPAADDR